MGVLKFFRYLSIKYPECMIKLKGTYANCTPANSKGISTDVLHYDLNAVFHPVAQELYKYGNHSDGKSLLKKPKKTPNPSEGELFSKICDRIEEIKTIINPTTGIYLAVDGVAGVSKANQQRKRRFKGCLDSEKSEQDTPPDKFDPNTISMGTPFMERLCNHITGYAKEQVSNKWGALKTIMSGHRVPGEGEHKLLAYIRKNHHQTHTIVSPDADLIFLAAGEYKSTCYIFRENIFDDIDANFFLVDIEKFRECILKEIGMSEASDTAKESAIKDFIIYCFLLGNDFLPQSPSLSVNTNAIELLFSIYPEISSAHGSLFIDNNINKPALKALFCRLQDMEYDMIMNNHKKIRSNFPNKMLMHSISYTDIPNSNRKTQTLNLPQYKSSYYRIKFNRVDPKTIVHEYLKGVVFVIRYYTQEIPSWEWQYPFHYTPFFSELSTHIDTFPDKLTFPPTENLSPLEQLLSVLPGKSSYLLPKPLRFLSTSEHSPIIDLYPVDFEVDLEGKKQEYEGTVILPHINVERLRTEFKKVLPTLSDTDLKLNEEDKIIQLN